MGKANFEKIKGKTSGQSKKMYAILSCPIIEASYAKSMGINLEKLKEKCIALIVKNVNCPVFFHKNSFYICESKKALKFYEEQMRTGELTKTTVGEMIKNYHLTPSNMDCAVTKGSNKVALVSKKQDLYIYLNLDLEQGCVENLGLGK